MLAQVLLCQMCILLDLPLPPNMMATRSELEDPKSVNATPKEVRDGSRIATRANHDSLDSRGDAETVGG